MRVFILICLLLPFSQLQARMPDVEAGTRVESLSRTELEATLAPIALYPDSLLSHILIASTYPLEVVQAARWRAANQHLDAESAREQVEDKPWSPSVKALVPFHQLLQSMDQDLPWLQSLGLAFQQDEQQILSVVQDLRKKAYQSGNLNNNQYVQVERQSSHISIQPVLKEVVYVPYYDTRVVYGHWSHHHHPVNWYSHNHYYDRHGFNWSIGFSIRPHFYFSNVYWHKKYVRVSHHYYQPYKNYKSYTRSVSHEYKRWHNTARHQPKVVHNHSYQQPHRQVKRLSHQPKRFVNPGYKPKIPRHVQQNRRHKVVNTNPSSNSQQYRQQKVYKQPQKGYTGYTHKTVRKQPNHSYKPVKRSDSRTTNKGYHHKPSSHKPAYKANSSHKQSSRQRISKHH